ncbi:MAG: hypothetical protein B6I37_02690 [Desulfobacteraceae bacterium 4572_35.2]|nr:MAG: hypothetical protein B6I37_02690 [Desulfobacteraceae bacterium 4572_35.2]
MNCQLPVFFNNFDHSAFLLYCWRSHASYSSLHIASKGLGGACCSGVRNNPSARTTELLKQVFSGR